MWNGAIAAHLNQMKVLGFDDWIIDECKDLNAPFLCACIDAIRKEYPNAFSSGNILMETHMLFQVGLTTWMDRRASALDFMFKFNVGTICNNNSKVLDGTAIRHRLLYAGLHPLVTFIEDHDTDTTEGEQTIWNKMLGYNDHDRRFLASHRCTTATGRTTSN